MSASIRAMNGSRAMPGAIAGRNSTTATPGCSAIPFGQRRPELVAAGMQGRPLAS